MSFILYNNVNKFKKSHHISNLSQPLLQNSPIKYFFYLSIADDKSYKIISPEYKNLQNAHQFVQDFYNANVKIIKEFIKNNIFTTHKYIVENNKQKMRLFYTKETDIDHYLYFIKKSKKNYIEIFIFATNLKYQDTANYYLNYGDILERFSFYFSNELMNLNLNIKKGYLDNTLSEDKYFDECTFLNDNYSLINFAEQTHINKYYIISKDGEKFTLPRRQLQCLYYLNQGKTAKEIARILSISFRTVEVHLQTLKLKLDSNNKSDIIQYIQQDIKNFIEIGFKYKDCI